jgi:hypothetical protein
MHQKILNGENCLTISLLESQDFWVVYAVQTGKYLATITDLLKDSIALVLKIKFNKTIWPERWTYNNLQITSKF